MGPEGSKTEQSLRDAFAGESQANRRYLYFANKAIADEDLDRENDEKTSAVHFLRFEFGKPTRDALRAGASARLGCDHTHYPAHVSIAPETLASLAGDLA